MNVVAWVLVAISGLLGVVLVALSYRRSVPSATLADLNRTGLAMPSTSVARTLQFSASTTRMPGLFMLGSTLATVVLCIALSPALGSLVTISASAFLFGAAAPAGLYVASVRDSRRRQADPTLTRDTRGLRRSDFQSIKLRLVSHVGGVITVVAAGIFAVSGTQTIGYSDEPVLTATGLGIFFGVLGLVLAGGVFHNRLASIPVASSSVAELAWEDALRSVLFTRGIIATVNPGLLIASINSAFVLPAELRPAAAVFLVVSLCFYLAAGIYLFATRKRQPYMLSHLWPEVAATRAAGPTPDQSEVVAP